VIGHGAGIGVVKMPLSGIYFYVCHGKEFPP
jgi:hypothetical protein